jgi:large subunit ribosomal protein L28
MAYRCTVCEKGVSAGKTVSHSHRKTNRLFSANLQRVKVLTNSGPRGCMSARPACVPEKPKKPPNRDSPVCGSR